MEAVIYKKLINAEVKKGFYVFYNGEIRIVRDVENGKVVLSKNESVNVEEISNSVVKFIAETNDKTFSIPHSDYRNVMQCLYQSIPENMNNESKNYKTFMDALLDDCKITLYGSIVKIKAHVKVDDTVYINSLPIVDKYKLYNKNERTGVVSEVNKFNFKVTVGDKVIDCKREDFKIIGTDEISMYHVYCPNCGK